jgi:translocation and assembly module TamA
MALPAIAQKVNLAVKVIGEPINKKKLQFKTADYKDSSLASKALQSYIIDLNKEGYLEASVDSILKQKQSWTALVYIGNHYKFGAIHRGTLPLPLANKIGYSFKQFSETHLNAKEIAKIQEKAISLAENDGYPFASIHLDSIVITPDHRLHAQFNYNAGPLITVDSFIIVGSYEVKYKFFQRLLRMRKGEPFNQQKIMNSEKVLKELPYLKSMHAPEILISEGTTRVSYFLEKRKANVLDGYVGFLPNAAKNNKMLVTGDIKLELRNLLKTGKTLILNWQRFNEQSQYMKVFYEHPRFIGSSIDVAGLLEITRQDTSFLNINRELKLSQMMGYSSKLSFYTGYKTGRVLSKKSNLDTLNLSYGDYNNITYGLGYTLNKLDNIFYPKKGFLLNTKVSAGNKTILRNAFYPDEAYQNTNLNTVQINIEILAEKYIRLIKNQVLMIRLNTGQVYNDANAMYLNDFYRIGGLRTMRGFNENEFYVSKFGVGTLEYRFHTDEESYLLLFTDNAFISNPYVKEGNAEYLLGLGAGISFTTPAGVFNFVYSVGQSSTQKLSLSLSKIHFGLVSKF